MRERIYQIVGKASDYDYASRAYDIFVVTVALLSLVPLMFNENTLSDFFRDFLNGLDIVTAFILVFDYVFRWMTHDFKTGKGAKALFYYPITPMAIIDLLAILPTLNVIPQAFRFLRVLRIIKVFRYSRNLIVITNACYREAKTLRSVLIVACVYIVTVALVEWMCEPQAFTDFFDALAWATTVLTSVAFEDQRPIGYIGRLIAMLSSLVGVMLIALPAGIITGAYLAEAHAAHQDKSGYFRMVGPTKKKLSDYESIPAWLSNNRKVFRYITVMVLSLIVTSVCYVVTMAFDFPFLFDQAGAAISAFLLETSAGIIVGMITAVVGAVVNGDTTSILYVAMYACTAIAFGITFPRSSSSHKALRLLGTIAILVFGSGTIEGAVFALRNGYTYEGFCSWFTMIKILEPLGLPQLGTVVVAIYVERLIESLLIIIVFMAVVKVFGVHAAPSEKEVKQQQKILLDRALEQERLDELDSRTIFKESLLKKQRELSERQHEVNKELNLVNKRLDEIAAEESLEQL